MFRKYIISLVLCGALLLIVSTLAAAQSQGQVLNQTGIGTATPMVEPPSTPLSDLPLSGSQTGACPMMSGAGMNSSMSGMDMGGGMSGTGMTGGMSVGMNMGGMSGMDMSGTSGMSGMQGMNMAGAGGMKINLSTPWYANPWWVLGWVILTLVVIAILTVSVLGVIWMARRSRQVPASVTS